MDRIQFVKPQVLQTAFHPGIHHTRSVLEKYYVNIVEFPEALRLLLSQRAVQLAHLPLQTAQTRSLSMAVSHHLTIASDAASCLGICSPYTL